MSRFPPEIAIDEHGELVYTAELKATALARHVQALGASFLITLHADTKFVTVRAITQDVYLKWALTDTDWCSAVNFDEVIVAGSRLVFAIPNEVNGVPFTRIMLIPRVAGAIAIVIEK